MEGQFRDPLMVKPQIGGRLRSIIVRCLKTDPAQRYASAKEVEDDLMGFVRAAGIDNPGEVIARYLQGTRAFSAAFRARIIEAETALGQQAMKNGDVMRAMDAFNRVLAIDERNEQVLFLVRNLGRRQQLRRISTWAVAIVSLVCVVLVLMNARLGMSGTESAHKKAEPAKPAAPVNTRDVGDKGTRAAPDPPRAAAPGTGEQGTPPTAANAEQKRVPPKVDPAVPPIDLNAPRHVVLRPTPQNVSIGIDDGPMRAFGPSFSSVDLKPGTYKFKYQGAMDCCFDEEVTVVIPPGVGNYVVPQQLRFKPAMLMVRANVLADVFVDEKERGRAFGIIRVAQPAMERMHVVRISAAGYADVTREVRLRAGQVENLEVKLEEAPKVAPPPG
jgi:hypothetical protein